MRTPISPIVLSNRYFDELEMVIENYGLKNQVHEKGYPNKPKTYEQKSNNKEKLKTGTRAEHIFGFMEQYMNCIIVKYIGIKRATEITGLINLTYYLFKYEQVTCLNILQVHATVS